MGVSGQLSPMAAALSPPTAPRPRIQPHGLCWEDRVLGVLLCTQGGGHKPWPGTGGHWTPRGLTAAWLGGEGVSASSPAPVDRQTEGMIHVSGCGPRAKTGEMFDVRMPQASATVFPRLCPRCPGVPAWPGGRKRLKQHGMRPMH